jgi:hypothetical protein
MQETDCTFFHLQVLAQEIQALVLKQVSEIMVTNLGYCPLFSFSQVPFDHDAKLKVVIGFTLEPSKGTAAIVGRCTKPYEKGIPENPKNFNLKFGKRVLDDSPIPAASPRITTFIGSSPSDLFFSGLILAHFANLTAFPIASFKIFRRVLISICKRIGKKYRTFSFFANSSDT